MKPVLGTIFALALFVTGFSGPALAMAGDEPGPPASGSRIACNYDCLVGIMNNYLAAMVRHDPHAIPLARHYKYTEDAARIPMGDGLWLSATQAPTTFKIIAADPYAGEVGVLAMMKEWGKPILLGARLRVVNRRITEIEHVIASNLSAAEMKNLVAPRKAFLEDVPKAERTSRAAMIAAANGYYDAIEHSNARLAPFADDCVRHENGIQTTTNKGPAPKGLSPARARLRRLGCAAEINSRALSYITKISPRHILVVDTRKGLVMAFARFVHRGNVRKIRIVGVPGVGTIPMHFGPIDLQATELWKIRGGKIHQIEANGFLNAYLSPTGWDREYPPTE